MDHGDCYNCGGDGFSVEGGDCPACHGTGRRDATTCRCAECSRRRRSDGASMKPTSNDRADDVARLMDNSPLVDDREVSDLLANVMHYCDREGIDFDDQLRIARDYHTDEVSEQMEDN